MKSQEELETALDKLDAEACYLTTLLTDCAKDALPQLWRRRAQNRTERQQLEWILDLRAA